MAPRKRTSRKRTPATKADQANAAEETPKTPTATLGSLPTEILLEILGYLYVKPIPYRWGIVTPFKRNHPGFEFRNFLRAISQTCRSLRSFALPLLWKRIEVCSSDHDQRNLWERDLATELVRQLEITTVRDPSLAYYVSTVNILITRFSIKPVVDELARCLPLFPNLSRLQILGNAGPELHYETAFKDVILPNVHLLFVPDVAIAIVKCCPNVRRVIKVGTDEHINMYKFADSCRLIEEIYGFDIDHRADLNLFIQQFPLTKVVNIFEHEMMGMYADPGFETKLTTLRHLECIRVELGLSFDPEDLSMVPPEHDVFALSEQALQASSQLYPPRPGAHKCLIKVHHQKSFLQHVVISGDCQSDDRCPHFYWSKSGY